MAQLTIRQLEENVVRALEARAAHRGVSLEEEVRAALAASVDADRAGFARQAAALRAATMPAPPYLDSARIIREERDATG